MVASQLAATVVTAILRCDFCAAKPHSLTYLMGVPDFKREAVTAVFVHACFSRAEKVEVVQTALKVREQRISSERLAGGLATKILNVKCPTNTHHFRGKAIVFAFAKIKSRKST